MENNYKKLKNALINEKIAEKIITIVDDLIWKTTYKIKQETDDKWNISFLLHHLIIERISLLIAEKLGYLLNHNENSLNISRHIKPKKGNIFHTYNVNKDIEQISFRANPIFNNLGFFHQLFISKVLTVSLSKLLDLIFFPLSKKTNFCFYVKKVDLQKKYMEDLFKDINLLLLEFEFEGSLIFENFISDNFILLREIKLLNFFQFPKLFIAGSRLFFLNRFIACMTMKTHGFVIGSTHGNSIYPYNEPCFLYGDYSCANILLEYGSKNALKVRNNDYSVYKRIFRSSKTCLKLSSNYKKVIDPEQKIIYAPTSLSGNNIYFPYRQIPDLIYISHWDYLLSSCPYVHISIHPNTGKFTEITSFDQRIIKKLHDFYHKWNSRILHNPFQETLMNNNFVVFMTDYISTSSTEILSARKKLIFIDMNLRKVYQDYWQNFKKECFCLSLRELYEDKFLLNKVFVNLMNNYKKEKNNKFFRKTDKYSFNIKGDFHYKNL